jgi:hypothetical protein
MFKEVSPDIFFVGDTVFGHKSQTDMKVIGQHMPLDHLNPALSA